MQMKSLEAYTHAVFHRVADFDFTFDFGPLCGVKILHEVLLGIKLFKNGLGLFLCQWTTTMLIVKKMAPFHKEGASQDQTIMLCLPVLF